MYYSAQTGGFYDAAIHGDNIPSDAVEITTVYHTELLNEQSAGKMISSDDKGFPLAITPQQPIRSKPSLLEEVAAHRWKIETGGIVLGGVPISTDRESQAQLNSAYTSLSGGLISDTPWKASDGSFTMLTMAGIEPVVQAVAAHVCACFAAEKAHCEAIEALVEQSEIDAYDVNANWPK